MSTLLHIFSLLIEKLKDSQDILKKVKIVEKPIMNQPCIEIEYMEFTLINI